MTTFTAISLYLGDKAYCLFSLLTILGYLIATQRTTTARRVAYARFLQPDGKSSDQKDRLDKLYSPTTRPTPAYDAAVTPCSASPSPTSLAPSLPPHPPALPFRPQTQSKNPGKRLVWVDIGGGTGWNIEQMNAYCPVEVFDAIYLIDLYEPLLEVARKRFFLPEWASSPSTPRQISLVSLSYSLSMMPFPFPLLDHINTFLDPHSGLLSIYDFYVSPRISSTPLTHLMGDTCTHTRHVNWFGRWFWLHWLHADLHPSRKAYVEYVFGTVKSLNGRNGLKILPRFLEGFFGIPYYVGVFTKKDRDVSAAVRAFEIDGGNATSTGNSPASSASSSPTLSAGGKHTQLVLPVEDGHLAMPELALGEPLSALTKLDTASISKHDNSVKDMALTPSGPLSSFHYQLSKHYRLPYLDSKVHKEFRHETLQPHLLALTSAGDNLLHYAIKAAPRRLHAVDMNPCRNHLLELKLAAICALEYEDFWRLFGEGRHPDFHSPLDLKLSPFLSAHAYQFWHANDNAFSSNFYLQGYSGSALRRVRLRAADGGRADAGRAEGDLAGQGKAGDDELVDDVDLCEPGVYVERAGSADESGEYVQEGDGRVATPKANAAAILENFCLHADSIINVLTQLPPASLTIAVWMDHCDWFKPPVPLTSSLPPPSSSFIHKKDKDKKDNSALLEDVNGIDHSGGKDEKPEREPCELRQAIRALKKALKPKGRVFWRSAAMEPWYARLFAEEGFEVERIGVREVGAKVPIDDVLCVNIALSVLVMGGGGYYRYGEGLPGLKLLAKFEGGLAMPIFHVRVI
ncbi:hypothetical protein BOTBODRAFT_43462 [Botryobasidium botryosum FD-172 SS1]|uniref:Methyltransferase domain-containing protein n=1 Tax=Botryobasidium botryosum (strain FD-172 SS1) TaxID=930990 RepID=A0A067MYC9_BOTB1|nr:hypothetical protein BOTBODRAFT_43462 [Botryobasidium botryosum FD-172 SS1]